MFWKYCAPNSCAVPPSVCLPERFSVVACPTAAHPWGVATIAQAATPCTFGTHLRVLQSFLHFRFRTGRMRRLQSRKHHRKRTRHYEGSGPLTQGASFELPNAGRMPNARRSPPLGQAARQTLRGTVLLNLHESILIRHLRAVLEQVGGGTAQAARQGAYVVGARMVDVFLSLFILLQGALGNAACTG